MKKKIRVLSILLCFVFLFFVGCGAGEEEFGDEGEISTRMLSGVKVLSKPSSYNFKDAVGEMSSENYYNIFAHEILQQLYSVYETTDTVYPDQIFDFTSDELANGLTYQHFGDNENNKYYLYDSIRYTITQVTSKLDASDEVTSQTITIDTNSGWNWSVPTNLSEESKTIFDKIGYTIEGQSWLNSVVRLGADVLPSFSQYYATDHRKTIDGDDNYADFYLSPTYVDESVFDGTLVNYYQDALEYATYLFVLGFDYVDESGAEIADEKDYFDFIIDLTKPEPVQVKAKAFGDNAVSITTALNTVKDWYKKMGNIVGLTDKNKEQLSRFILDKVIGEKGLDKDTFVVKMYKQKPGESATHNESADLKFSRNYKAVVENIINYACTQTRIGYSVGDEGITYLNLDQEYMASEVTDYPGNNFFVNYTNGSGESDDTHMFDLIQPGEYQSFVLMPQASDVRNQLPLTDIWLAFEYYNDDADAEHDVWESDPTKEYADEITINVGFRFFDKTPDGGTVIKFTEKQMKIPYGRYDSFIDIDAGKNPDQNWLYISTEDVGENSIKINQKIIFDSNYGLFNNDIGGGALDATKYENKSFPLSGLNKARDYYMTNPSSSYGTYGTLNPDMFKGEDGCDYMEVYFDIVKDKTSPNVNYNFKVALVNIFYYDAENDIGPTN